MKTLYIPVRYEKEIKPLLEENLKRLEPYSCIGVVATAQHLHHLDEVREYLFRAGKKVPVTAQVLGCRQEEALSKKEETDCFLYLGSGRFHPIALAYRSGKPVHILNPVSEVFEEIPDKEVREYEDRRKTRLRKAAGAKTYGIMVSTKPGQKNMSQAIQLKEYLEEKNMKGFILVGDQLNRRNTLPFDLDCLVNTACPRLVEDEFDKPVLNPDELKELYG